MASPSSFTSRNYMYNVFASFHGPDVRKTLLSHIREQFNRSGITMFDDQEIVRSATIAPSLTEAIRESRISIVILSKKYASSSWCLDELVEILECKEAMGQIVMTIFYGVEPSDVRKQIGKFGMDFNETCARKTDEERQKWSKALQDVGNIAGEDFLRWDNEAKMIKKIAKDVLDKLNATPSKDFDGMVGLEAHLREMESLLDLDHDGVKMVAISGPAGIGKTTIARALYNKLSCDFPLRYFMENVKGSYKSINCDEHGLKLRLQEQLLQNILNQSEMKISHLKVIYERLHNQKVLIILDDVDHLDQLEALANETTWFGSGSRIVVTTEDQELLHQHGIDKTYHVDFPSNIEALQILCLSAFKQISPPNGFEYLAIRAAELCSKLPLGLRVVGSSLRGRHEEGWEATLHRLETSLDKNMEKILRVGYDNLHEKDQALFLYIAVFFNYTYSNILKAMLAVDERYGLKTLVDKSLISISTSGYITMHKLLQLVATQEIKRQGSGKRHILMDPHEICNVLQDETGTSTVSGISFDISDIDEVSIKEGAFKKMSNLRFLNVYKSKNDGKNIVHIPEDMELPHRLRLLHWKEYPSKCLPRTFHPEYLVKLDMKESQLEYLWQGSQPLPNLKKMNLSESQNLKELPDVSNATNLETLELNDCASLVEIPSSYSHLHKLKALWMAYCINLEAVPAHMKLASLEQVNMKGCSKLRILQVISTEITVLDISETRLEDLPASIRLCSRLWCLTAINCKGNLNGLARLPTSITHLDLRCSDMEKIPDCIKDLPQLQYLNISGCRKVTSLPQLSGSLNFLYAVACKSLKDVFCPLNTPKAILQFTNCFKLGKQARRRIIQQSFLEGMAILPGKEVPAEFDHRANGDSLTISLDGDMPLTPDTRFEVCLVVSFKEQTEGNTASPLFCRATDPSITEWFQVGTIPECRTEHLFIFPLSCLEEEDESTKLMTGITLEFSSGFGEFDVIECGALILTDENIRRSYKSGLDQGSEDENDSEPNEAFEEDMDDQESEGRIGYTRCQILPFLKESVQRSHDDSITNRRSESEYGEASKDKHEDIPDPEDDHESVSRKRPRKTIDDEC